MKFISEDAASKATPAKVIKYVMNPAKCCKNEDGEILMSAIGMDNDRPYSQQFREIAELAGNEYELDDRKYYHFKHTVSPEDYQEDGVQNITPEQLLRETEDLVLENFDGYQALITIQYHNNGLGANADEQLRNLKHLHAHVVLNASSFDFEKNKLDLRDRDLDKLRDYAYEAGLKYNLHEKYWRDEVAAKRAAQQQAREQEQTEVVHLTKGEQGIIEKYGKDFSDHSWKEQYRIAIREAAGVTTNLESFQDYLKDRFQISTQITNQGNIKYKFPDRKNYTSGKALGTDYELEAVEKALAENRSKPSDLPQPTREQTEALEWKKRFDQEAERFKKWESEYRKWQQTDKRNEEDAEIRQDRLILENTAAFYRICEETVNNEALAASLTNKQREEMAELVRCRERLIQQERADGSYKPVSDWQREFDAFREEQLKKFSEDLDDTYQHRRDTRSAYYNAVKMLRNSNNLITSLVAYGMAVNALKKEEKINQQIQDLWEQKKTFTKNTSDPDTFYKVYGSDIAAGKMPGKEYLDTMGDAYKAFERAETREKYIAILQTTGTSLADRITAAQGIRDMNMAEGIRDRENELYHLYGTDTRQVFGKKNSHTIYAKRDWKVQGMIDAVNVYRELGANNSAELELKVKQEGREYGKIKKEYTAAKKQHDEAVNAATAEINQDGSLSVEDRIKKIEEVKAAEYEKLRPIEEKYHTAKEHYKRCARALDTVKTDEIKQTLYCTEPTADPAGKQTEAPRRSKEQAEKERLEQWSELREWADKAIETVAKNPGNSKEANLKKWAAEMEKHGVTVRITENTISLKHPNSNQAVRTNRLGKIYEKEEISNGIYVSIQQEAGRAETDRTAAGRTEQQQTNGNGRAAQGNNRAQNHGRELVRERRLGDDFDR